MLSHLGQQSRHPFSHLGDGAKHGGIPVSGHREGFHGFDLTLHLIGAFPIGLVDDE